MDLVCTCCGFACGIWSAVIDIHEGENLFRSLVSLLPIFSPSLLPYKTSFSYQSVFQIPILLLHSNPLFMRIPLLLAFRITTRALNILAYNPKPGSQHRRSQKELIRTPSPATHLLTPQITKSITSLSISSTSTTPRPPFPCSSTLNAPSPPILSTTSNL